MSLGGFALAIGVLVDASIVMVENAHRHLAAANPARGSAGRESAILAASRQVGRAIFFSLVIIVVSFLPVFLLTGEEGRLFHPLAFTKTFAIAAASILSITLVPILMGAWMRGRNSSRFHLRNSGSSQAPFQPRNAASTSACQRESFWRRSVVS